MADTNNVVTVESNAEPGKEAGTPNDITPSRRSSRKKQSTFSDDFEYYTPTGRKKEEDKKPSPLVTPKEKKKTGSQKSGDSEEEEEDVEESVEKKLVTKKGASKVKVVKGKPKTIVKKAAKKGLSPQKKKKAVQKQKAAPEDDSSEEEEETDEEEEEEGTSSEESVEEKVTAGKKRKAAQLVKNQAGKKGKAIKKQKKTEEKSEDEAESSSDEDDSTPISQLQAQLKQQQAAAKESPLVQNLAKKLLEVGADSSSGLDGEGDAISVPGTKRKQAGDGEDASPAKKAANVSRLGSALASLVKNTPPEDLGLVKRSPSEIAAKMKKQVTAIKSVIKEEDSSSAQKSKLAGLKDSKPANSVGVKIKQEGNASESKTSSSIEKKSVKSEKDSEASVKSEKVEGKVNDELVKKKVKFEEQNLKQKSRKIVVTKDGKASVLSTGKDSLVKKESSNKPEPPRKLTESELRQKKIEQIKAKIAEKSGGQRSFLEKHGKSKSPDGSGSKHIKREGSKDIEMNKKKFGETKVKAEVSGKKFSSNLASHLAKKKSEAKGHEEIFKRGILHKKKSHQPFGNKNVVKKLHDKSSVKDSVSGDSSAEKKSKTEKEKGIKSEEGRRKSSDGERRRSKEDKGERRFSHDGSKKQRKTSQGEESSSKETNKGTDSSEPPVLTPASAIKPAKHKHHKPEHEVPVDMSMMDLFKPDGLIVHDPATTTPSQPEVAQSTSSSTEGIVRPEDVHHVLLEHQYSKTSAAAHGSGDNETGFHASEKSVSVASGRDDVESMSHNNSVIMDASLPEQILEESSEEMVSSTQDVSATLSNGSKQESPGDRASILETLNTELQESGTDFLIVGQVEVSRQASDTASIPASSASSKKVATSDSEGKRKESSTTLPSAATIPRKRKDSERSSGARKKSIDTQSPAGDKKKEKAKDKKDQKKAATKGDEKKKGEAEGDEESGEEDEDFEDDENDIDWEDPDTLYCLCRKPHNNRFMICCDKCEEWYHGTCVGITRARGKEMEDNEEEYTCPICIKGDGISVLEKPPPASKSAEPPSPASKLLQKCVGRKCSKTPRQGSVYCSNECIMNHARESLKAIRDEHAKKVAKEKQTSSQESSGKSSLSKSTHSSSSSSSSDVVEVMERETGKILRGPNAPTQKGLHRWLEQHPSFEVVQPHKHRSSSRDSRDSKDERSAEKKDHRSSSTSSSSSSKEKKSDDRSHHHRHHSDHHHHHKDSSRRQSSGGTSSSSSSREHSAKKIDGDSRRSSSSSSTSSSQKVESSSHGSSHRKEEKRSERSSSGGPNQIRINVRTALRDCLLARAKDAEDILLSSNEIKALSLEIEEKLFDLFNDTGHKYRAKYRSLIFNIKDQKNKGLFRKILNGKISPDQLVLMSTEDLASRELAKWREQESKHQIEMIEKLEKEKQETKSTSQMTKKTHKGEIEVNDEDLSTLETRLEEKKDNEPDKIDEQAQEPAIDTTSEHRAHLFDLNCKVCTGKIVPGPEAQSTATPAVSKPVKPKKGVVKFSLPEDEEEKEPKQNIISSSNDVEEKQEPEEEDYEKAAEIVKEALEHVHKAEEELSSLPSMVSSSPKHHEPALSPPLSPKDEPEDVDMELDEDDDDDDKQTEVVSKPSSDLVKSKSSIPMLPSPSTPPAPAAVEKKVVVRSPDSALQSGLEAKAKFTPTSPVLWKGFVSMLDVAKFFTSAYRVSGPVDHISIPDTVHIMGRISPDHMWDYLSKIRQAGSKDITLLRFIPGSDEEKVAYIHLYSYLNSRARCGVANNPSRQVKDFYIVPLASHSKIPRTLLPFDGPGLEENRPHMLIGILVKQRDKHSKDSSSDTSSPKSSSSSSRGHKADKVGSTSSGNGDKGNSSSSSKKRTSLPGASRDPRLAKLAAKAESPKPVPASNGNSNSSSNTSETNPNDAQISPDMEEEYDPEYVPALLKAKGSSSAPVAAYIPTPTAKKKDQDHKSKAESKTAKSKTPSPEDSGDSESKEKHHHHHHHHHHKDHHRHHQHHHKAQHSPKHDRGADEDDSEPYSPSKEAEPYSPGQEAAAEEPYDPEDESLMDDDGHPITSSATNSAGGKSTTVVTAGTTSTSSASAVSATSSAVSTSGLAQTAEKVTEDTSNLSSEELVERMARSNDPSQISNLMVMALSQASTQHEQQQLLVKLTRQVEDRKLQLAEEMQRSSSSKVQNNTTNVSSQLEQKQEPQTMVLADSSSESKEDTNKQTITAEEMFETSVSLSSAPSNNEEIGQKESQPEIEKAAGTSSSTSSAPASSQSHTASADLSTELDKEATSSNSGGIRFTIKPRSKSPFKPALLGSTFSSSKTENLKPSESSTTTQAATVSTPLTDTNSQSTTSDRNDAASSRPQLPEALKALMNDVMGGTDTPALEQRTKLLTKNETQPVGKLDGVGKEKDEAKTDSNKQSEHDESQRNQEMSAAALEAKKRSEDEDEARRILESLKKSSTSTTSSANTTTVKPVEPAPKPTKAPSIDELLDRLKKGGFQFPLQKNSENTTTAAPSAPSTSSPTVTTAEISTSAPVSTSILSSSLLESVTTTSPPSLLTNPSVPTYTASKPLLSSTPGAPFSSNNSSSGVESSTLLASAEDVDLRIGPPPPQKLGVKPTILTAPPNTSGHIRPSRTETLQDRDDRLLYAQQDRDERAFRSGAGPKHPLDPHAFPPLPGMFGPSRIPPHPPGPDIPSYQPTPRSILPAKGRSQPPPPGTEFEKPAEVLGITDVDLRHPPLPPPLPPQPPPPLPPLPHHQFREDVDYRNQDPYRPLHHGFNRGRGGHSYHRP